MTPIIEIKNLSFNYGSEAIIKNLSLGIAAGSFLAIAGPNGAGKTTLLNLICGFIKPDSGNILIDSKPLKGYSAKMLARQIAVVRQEFVPVFDFKVAEIVSMARTPYLSTLCFESQEDKEIINQAMEITDTARFADRSMRNLSGGERQRVFIARALAQQSPILLLDEPTSFLDLKHQVDIFDLLKEAQTKTNKTIVSITHDINLANQYCDSALLMSPDKKYHIGSPDEVFNQERISEVFGVKTVMGTVKGCNFFMPFGRFS